MSSSDTVSKAEFDAFSTTVMGLIGMNSTITAVIARLIQKNGWEYDDEFTPEERESLREAETEVIAGITAALYL